MLHVDFGSTYSPESETIMKLTYDGNFLLVHLRGANKLNAKEGKIYVISTLLYDKDSCNMKGLEVSEKIQQKSEELGAKSDPCFLGSQKPLSVRINVF